VIRRGPRDALALAAGFVFLVTVALAAPSRADDEPEAHDEPAGDVDAVEASVAAASPRGGVTVVVTPGPSGIQVEGRCRVEASRADAWEVLTDYDGIDGFVSSMRESRVMERATDHVLVEQVAVGRLFLFSRRMRVVLWVHEQPPSHIQFEDVLRRDFEDYRGDWQVVEHGDEVEIVYRVSARPAFNVPDVVARGVFRRTVRDLVSEVGAEIVRRAQLAAH
jgi:hypothetical protein